MANTDLTINSYHSLNALGNAVCALVELAELIPQEGNYSSLLRIIADRLESDFTAMRNDAIMLWPELEEKGDHAKEGAR